MVWSGEGILLRPLAEDRLGEPQNGPGVARPRVPHAYVLAPRLPECPRVRHTWAGNADRKSTRLNSSHVRISYAVFCLKKKKELCAAVHRLDRARDCGIK